MSNNITNNGENSNSNSNSSQEIINHGIKRDNDVITFIPIDIVVEINEGRKNGRHSLDGGADSLWNNLYHKYGFSTEEFDEYIKILNKNIGNTAGKIEKRAENIEEVSIDNIEEIINYLDVILESLRETKNFEVENRNHSQTIERALRNLKNKGGLGNDFKIFENDINSVEVSDTTIDKLDEQEEIAIKMLSDKIKNEDIELHDAFDLLCSSINYFTSYGETLNSRTIPLIESFRSYFQIQKDKNDMSKIEY